MMINHKYNGVVQSQMLLPSNNQQRTRRIITIKETLARKDHNKNKNNLSLKKHRKQFLEDAMDVLNSSRFVGLKNFKSYLLGDSHKWCNKLSKMIFSDTTKHSSSGRI